MVSSRGNVSFNLNRAVTAHPRIARIAVEQETMNPSEKRKFKAGLKISTFRVAGASTLLSDGSLPDAIHISAIVRKVSQKESTATKNRSGFP